MSKRLIPIILQLLEAEAMGAAEIAKACGVVRQSVSPSLKSMHSDGLIHIERRVGMQQKPLYRAGAGDDAPRKATLRDLIPSHLEKRPATSIELAELLGVSRQIIGAIITQLNDTGVKIRICAWRQQKHGPHLAVYALGGDPDAERPAPMTNAEKIAKYRATPKGKKTSQRCTKRWRNSLAGKEYGKKYWSSRYAKEKFAKQGVAGFDPLLASIMGLNR